MLRRPSLPQRLRIDGREQLGVMDAELLPRNDRSSTGLAVAQQCTATWKCGQIEIVAGHTPAVHLARPYVRAGTTKHLRSVAARAFRE
jgi:hypothetical protein